MSVVKRRAYTEQFKTEAIRLAESVGMAKAGKDLGVNPANIRRWQRDLQRGPSQGRSSASLDDLEKENFRLKKELRYVNEINDVLKKSLGIFVKETPSR